LKDCTVTSNRRSSICRRKEYSSCNVILMFSRASCAVRHLSPHHNSTDQECVIRRFAHKEGQTNRDEIDAQEGWCGCGAHEATFRGQSNASLGEHSDDRGGDAAFGSESRQARNELAVRAV